MTYLMGLLSAVPRDAGLAYAPVLILLFASEMTTADSMYDAGLMSSSKRGRLAMASIFKIPIIIFGSVVVPAICFVLLLVTTAISIVTMLMWYRRWKAHRKALEE